MIIKEHGRPVGRLSPAEQGLEERLTALQAAGLVAWNGQKLNAITPWLGWRLLRPAKNAGLATTKKVGADLLVEMRV